MKINIKMEPFITMLKGLVVLTICAPVVLSISCYQCSGMTNYDPGHCFHPREKDAIFVECNKGEICEKTIHHIDRWQSVVSRGCSANCDGREYIYTDDFQTHCCKDKNRCNGVISNMRLFSGKGFTGFMFVTVAVLVLRGIVL